MPNLLNIFNRNVLLLLLSVLIFSTQQVSAQTAEQYIKQGDKSYADADYYTAFYYFNKAKEVDSSGAEVYFKLAETARNMNDYKNAFTFYENVLRTDKYKNFPLAEFWMGMMKKYLGDYNKASGYFSRFVDRYSLQDYYKKKAIQEKASLAWVAEHKDTLAKVQVQRMGNEINTSFSEFAASQLNDSVYQFSSIREQGSSLSKDNEKFLSKIYTMRKENDQWKSDKSLFTWLDKFELQIANGSFSEDGQRFYFNVCAYKNSSDLRCDIYLSKQMNGVWQEPEKLGAMVNDEIATNTQPFEAGNQVLYFASDRKGGIGKLDIWYSLRDANGNYAAAQNIGPTINTADNEISPYFNNSNQSLYFSSEWYYGYGGYDIFYAKKVGEGQSFEEPENIGLPINSSCNDIYFNYTNNNKKAYLSSNRKGSLFLKGESCCNDIYVVNFPQQHMDTPTIALNHITTKDTSLLSTNSNIKTSDTNTTDLLLAKLKSMLPVTVYFHNDLPNARSTSDTTDLNYKRGYDEYSMMRNEYISEYAKKVSHEKSVAEITKLFDVNIDEGYRKLLLFTNYLTQALKAGKTVKLTIEGYCSPLALNEYNIHLANRRIASLKNYLAQFDNGFFTTYLASGKLIYVKAPFGEEKADQQISDDRLDTPSSVYDPRAALERRVAIIAIESTNQ